MTEANNTLCACGCQQVVLTPGHTWRRGHYAKVHPTHSRHTRRLLPQTPEERRAKDIVFSRAYRAANKEKVAAKSRAHRAAHKAEFAAKDHAYYLTHKEESTAYNRAYYLAHKAEIAGSVRAYNVTHKADIAARKRAYRARKATAPLNDLTHAQWVEIQTAQKHLCYYCGKRCKGQLTQDHITPLSKGGSHTLHNVIGACRSCNSRKRTGPPLQPVQPLLLTAAPSKKRTA